MTDNAPRTVDAETQTVIRVFPHLLDHIDEVANISSDKKLQSVISIKPNEETSKFFSLLRFTPYSEIKENSIRVIDLERKKKLQFATTDQAGGWAENALRFSLADDDGVGDICSDILRRRLLHVNKSSFFDCAVQTDVKVQPHILEDQNVATVSEDKETQTEAFTSGGCSKKNATNTATF